MSEHISGEGRSVIISLFIPIGVSSLFASQPGVFPRAVNLAFVLSEDLEPPVP